VTTPTPTRAHREQNMMSELRQYELLVEALQWLPMGAVVNFADRDDFIEEVREMGWKPRRECKSHKFIDSDECVYCHWEPGDDDIDAAESAEHSGYLKRQREEGEAADRVPPAGTREPGLAAYEAWAGEAYKRGFYPLLTEKPDAREHWSVVGKDGRACWAAAEQAIARPWKRLASSVVEAEETGDVTFRQCAWSSEWSGEFYRLARGEQIHEASTLEIKLRPVVRWFAEQMEAALRRNDHKGGWHECDPVALARRVGQELKELRGAMEEYGPPGCGCREAACPHARIFTPSADDIIGEAADVGAMAAMVADHFREGGPSEDQGRTGYPASALPAGEAVGAWVPVPHDDYPPQGSTVLAYHPSWGVREGWVNSLGSVSGNWPGGDLATHFMPLPAPPAREGGK
jgi:hypothetical protein